MNFQNNYQYSNYNINNNSNEHNKNRGRYIGLNRLNNINNQNFFFQPNQMNLLQTNETRGESNNIYSSYKNNLNKSSDITNVRTINTSQIRQTLQKLNNDIKKINGIVHLRNNNLSQKKNNSYLNKQNNNSGTSNINSNYTSYLRNNQNQKDIYNYQKLNQTYKINNNINKNYYITYDMKKMKFNINNNNLHPNNNYSDNEMYQRKFSQSTHIKKNKYKNYLFTNKSVLNNENNNFDLNNFDNNQYYKSSSIYKGIKNNNKYGINIKNFSLNQESNENEENNVLNYNILKDNLLARNNPSNINVKQPAQYQSKKYNNLIGSTNSQSSKMKSSNNYEMKNNSNNYNIFKYNTKIKEFDGNDSDNLSELADEFIEAFNIDIIKDEDIEENFQKKKSSNIHYNNNLNFFSKSDIPQSKSRSKEINMNIIINKNNFNNIAKTSPRIYEKNNPVNSYSNNSRKKIEEQKEIKPFSEITQIEEESLIHDSQLDIPLIKETLIYNKVIKDNRDNDLLHKNEDDEKIKFEKNDLFKNISNMPLKTEEIPKINLNENKNNLNLAFFNENIQNEEKNDKRNINKEKSNQILNKEKENENSDNNEHENVAQILHNESNKENEIKLDENKKVSISKNLKEDNNNNIDEEMLVDKYVSKIENEQKEKLKRHITINEEQNIYINFKPEDPVTDIKIKKIGEEDMVPFERNFNLYQKILKSNNKYNPTIKHFDKNEIKIDPNYKLAEFLEEKDIIPELMEENDDDIKSLEKSMEKSIDKSFDKNYERSLNLSVNQSNNQSMTQSYMDNSFRNSGKLGNSTGGGLIQRLNKMFNINEDKSEYEENENEESQNNKDDETNKDKDIEEIEENDEENNDEEKNEEINEDDDKENDDEKVEEEEQEQEHENENEEENEEEDENEEQQENNDENENENNNEEEEVEEK